MVIEYCILATVPRVLLQGVGSGKAGALVYLVTRHIPIAQNGTLHIVGVQYIVDCLDYVTWCSHHCCEGSAIVVLILQMRSLRLREVVIHLRSHSSSLGLVLLTLECCRGVSAGER